ncbi:bifunctional enoyl-CoA hydratase/phosphate acetyltransferase [Roseicella aquatilis]|nr:bifunctional enoyl-CoA hydratase/phosphate acetyltransferase [Roseicella aquatilis]
MRHTANSPAPQKGIAISLPARDAVLAGFQGRFVEAQYVWTSFLLDHLIECRKRIGDLDAMLVLIVVGLSALRQVQKVRELEGEHISLGYRTSELPNKGETVNAYSIANITGIPRENVRRRLADLAEQGWLEQAPDGGWRIHRGETGHGKAAADLAELTASTVSRIADFIGRLATVSAAAVADRPAGDTTAGLAAPGPDAMAVAWTQVPPERPATRTGYTLGSLVPGLRAEHCRRIGPRAFDLAAALVGVPAAPAPGGVPGGDAALLLQGMLAEVAAQELPGPGGAVLGVDLDLHAAPEAGEEVTATLQVASVNRTSGIARLTARVTGEKGRLLAEGQLRVRPATAPVQAARVERAGLLLQRHPHIRAIETRAAALEPMPVAIAWPDDQDSLLGPLKAAQRGLIRPVLIGDPVRIEAAAREAGASLEGCGIEAAEAPQMAAARAVSLARDGRVQALVQGSLHADELMAAVLSRDGGLRGTRRLSHVFLLDMPAYHKPLLVTDAAVNIAPDLVAKADILQNAVDLGIALGIARPKVAILAAVETVNPKMPATLDAALLCKMADRGQVRGAILDGPLAFDTAMSAAAARVKGIESQVAGDPDILLCPDLEAGNMVAKQLAYLAGAEAAGIVLGARVPVILTSRAGSIAARIASIAMARLMVAAGG